VAKIVSGIRADGRIRLLWLIDSLAVGGAERLAAIFARTVDASRFNLSVVCLTEIDGNPLAAQLEAAGVRVTTLHARNLRDVGAFSRLLRLIRDEQIDVIHAHLTYAEIWGRVAGWLTGRSVVSTIHVLSYARPRERSARDRAIEALVGFVRRHFGGPVIAVSQALRQRLLNRQLPPERVVTVHNGIEIQGFGARDLSSRAQRRAEFGIPENAPVAITVAVVREGKGHDLLVDAAQKVLERMPQAHFLVVGGGPLEDALRRRVETEELAGNFHLTGMRADTPELLALADLFVLPSSQFDALPTAVIEAMAAGLPVIAFESGGVSEIVVDGHTGLIVPKTDASALSGAVLELLGDGARARHMGECGRSRVEAEFSALKWVAKLQEIYRKALPASSLSGPRATGADARPKLRIAVVEFLGRGGLLHYAYQLSQALAQQGAQVELLTDEEYELESLPHNFSVRRVLRLWNPRPGGALERPTTFRARFMRLGRRSIRAAMYYREWWRLLRLLRRERPDIVQFGEIRFATDLIPLLALRASGIRLADICHNIAPFDISADRTKISKESRLQRAIFRHIYACFDAIFVHSEVNRREFLRLYGGDGGRVHVIPHGNEGIFLRSGEGSGDEYSSANKLGVEGKAPTAIFFGTLTKYKGVEYLLDAIAYVRKTLPDVQLIVAGFPNQEIDVEALQRRAAEPDLAGAVKFYLQYVPVEEVADLFEPADVAVFPYLMIYQSGALQVAYSLGKPVVATDVGGLSEAVIEGETGLLVPPRDSVALAQAITKVLSDREMAHRMGERGRELSKTENSWYGIAASVYEIYARLAASGPRRKAEPR